MNHRRRPGDGETRTRTRDATIFSSALRVRAVSVYLTKRPDRALLLSHPNRRTRLVSVGCVCRIFAAVAETPTSPQTTVPTRGGRVSGRTRSADRREEPFEPRCESRRGGN